MIFRLRHSVVFGAAFLFLAVPGSGFAFDLVRNAENCDTAFDRVNKKNIDYCPAETPIAAACPLDGGDCTCTCAREDDPRAVKEAWNLICSEGRSDWTHGNIINQPCNTHFSALAEGQRITSSVCVVPNDEFLKGIISLFTGDITGLAELTVGVINAIRNQTTYGTNATYLLGFTVACLPDNVMADTRSGSWSFLSLPSADCSSNASCSFPILDSNGNRSSSGSGGGSGGGASLPPPPGGPGGGGSGGDGSPADGGGNFPPLGDFGP